VNSDKSMTNSTTSYIWGLGRRKSSIARVRIKPGAGAFLVNGRQLNEFFPVLEAQNRAQAPLKATELAGQYDVFCNVNGGGLTGQSDAVRLGLSRALKTLNPALDAALRAGGHLTRDSRMKERKKYGRRGARRGFQFSKR
jgi:small subunit ribosomal protein S9